MENNWNKEVLDIIEEVGATPTSTSDHIMLKAMIKYGEKAHSRTWEIAAILRKYDKPQVKTIRYVYE